MRVDGGMGPTPQDSLLTEALRAVSRKRTSSRRSPCRRYQAIFGIPVSEQGASSPVLPVLDLSHEEDLGRGPE